MMDTALSNAGARYAAAYQQWWREVCHVHGPAAAIIHFDTPEGRGEPGTALRQAADARQATYAAWLEHLGLGVDERPLCHTGVAREVSSLNRSDLSASHMGLAIK